MNKYFVYADDLCDEKPAELPGFRDHEVYLASDVDARIEAAVSLFRVHPDDLQSR
jgi:hypothetical protein